MEEKFVIKNARFITSVAKKEDIPTNGIPEIAVLGRSNVGKSSFINLITNHGKLAKTSKSPGRTRLLNYFSCNNDLFYLVDLPGYGFAKVSDSEKEKWGTLIEDYLLSSAALQHVFLLLDIRHNPTSDDKLMVNYLYHFHIPFTLIATKGDKLSKLQRDKQKRALATALTVGVGNILVTSALEKFGKDEVFAKIDEIVKNANEPMEEDDDDWDDETAPSDTAQNE